MVRENRDDLAKGLSEFHSKIPFSGTANVSNQKSINKRLPVFFPNSVCSPFDFWSGPKMAAGWAALSHLMIAR
jgi:hypothetical protein